MSTTTHKMLGSPTGNPEAAKVLLTQALASPKEFGMRLRRGAINVKNPSRAGGLFCFVLFPQH